MNEPRWTLDELAAHAQQVLAAEGVRAPNGRVRELGGDGRAIRWYAMKGLVDKPSIGPGHSARYGERHLLQLVAVKRLQAQGKTLAEIQRELAGATDETLRAVAALGPLETEIVAVAAAASAAKSAAGPASADDAPAIDGSATDAPAASSAPARSPISDAAATEAARAGAAPSPALAPAMPAPFAAASAPSAPAPARAPRFWAAPAAASPAATAPASGPAAEVRYLITLTEDVTLALSAQPGAADLAAIRAAAAPLLDLLAERGLTTTQGD